MLLLAFQSLHVEDIHLAIHTDGLIVPPSGLSQRSRTYLMSKETSMVNTTVKGTTSRNTAPIPHSGPILTALVLGTVFTSINLSIANVALPSVAVSLGATSSQQNWIATGFTLSLAATVLYLGAIADRYGRRA